MTEKTLRQSLRSIKVFPTDLPPFDTDAVPSEPLALLTTWLLEAIESGVAQPHAMVLSTVSAEGVPSARTLLLKDVTTEGVWFASLSSGPKGTDIAATGRVALTLYWREQGRQVRITGTAKAGPREVSEGDFLARHPKARAEAIAGAQSTPIVDGAAALERANRKIDSEPEYVPGDWTAYVVSPSTVEFWQAGPDRNQTRLLYAGAGEEWSKQLIWP